MKLKTVITVFLFASSPLVSMACDICGCGIGNNYIGILPEFNSKIIGVRYRSNNLWTDIGANGAHTYLTTEERYQTTELWGAWNLGQKFRVMATIPYHFNSKMNQGTSTQKNGFGDMSATVFYKLYNSKKTISEDKLLVQSLWIGGGIKAPTGYYADEEASATTANLFQLGTGSLDFSIIGMYDIRLNDAGINLTANYRMATENKSDYRYGNKFSNTTQFYYKFLIKNKLRLAPNAGVQYEKAAIDSRAGFDVANSGGSALLGTIGLEVNKGKWFAGANFQTPFYQNLALGSVVAENRFMVHLGISL